MMFVYTIGLVLIALGVILLWARWADRDTDEFISLSRPFSLFLAVLFILAMTSELRNTLCRRCVMGDNLKFDVRSACAHRRNRIT